MSKNLKQLGSVQWRWALIGAALGLASAAQADTVLVSWDFQNAKNGDKSHIAASSQSALVSTASFSARAGGVEDFGGQHGKVAVTRQFNRTANTPAFSFTLTQAVSDLQLSFNHFHNHNPGHPTANGYSYDVQIGNGNGADWRDVKTGLRATATNSGATESFALASGLAAGTYTMRWVGYGFTGRSSSGSEFFALDNVALSSVSAVPEPSSYALLALGLVGLAAVARRKRD